MPEPTPAPAPSTADKCQTFQRLHASGCFVLPNPWDAGSARYLQHLGFAALASTSAGESWAQGLPDNGLQLDQVLAHLRDIVGATPLPVNADFGNGWASDAAGVARSVQQALATGIAGLSIEDTTGDAAQPLFALDTALSRLRAARAAIDQAGSTALLVGRADGRLVGQPDLAGLIQRLQAYAAAGADVLYAPGLRTADEIRAVVQAVAPKPVNLLMGWAGGLTVADIAALGVRRISVGGALARCAWGGFVQAATRLAEQGRFDGFAQALPGSTLDTLFAQRSLAAPQV